VGRRQPAYGHTGGLCGFHLDFPTTLNIHNVKIYPRVSCRYRVNGTVLLMRKFSQPRSLIRSSRSRVQPHAACTRGSQRRTRRFPAHQQEHKEVAQVGSDRALTPVGKDQSRELRGYCSKGVVDSVRSNQRPVGDALRSHNVVKPSMQPDWDSQAWRSSAVAQRHD
jgi:hypothetical protein